MTRPFEHAQIELAKRMFHLCCTRYTGPDPLGLGIGWCVIAADLIHPDHRDQFGRTWPTSATDGTIIPRPGDRAGLSKQ